MVAKGIIIIENYYCDTVGTIYISLCFVWLAAGKLPAVRKQQQTRRR